MSKKEKQENNEEALKESVDLLAFIIVAFIDDKNKSKKLLINKKNHG